MMHSDARTPAEAFSQDSSNLIPLLQSAQQKEGYISPDTVEWLSEFLGTTESHVYGVASFYSQFRFTPPARHCISVCLGTACHVQGGELLVETLHRDLGVNPGECTQDGLFEVHRVACLGCCALAPVVKIDDTIASMMTVTKLQNMLGGYEQI